MGSAKNISHVNFFDNKKLKTKKIVLVLIVLVLTVTSAFGVQNSAQADEFDEKIAAIESNNSSHQHEVSALQHRASNIQDAINKMQSRINDLRSSIAKNKQKSAKLKNEIIKAEAELDKQRDVLGQNIRKMYVEDEISTFEMLATSKDLSDFMDKQQYRSVVSSEISEQLEVIKALKKELASKRKQVDALIKQDEESKEEIAAQKAEQNRLLALNKAEQSNFNKKIKANNAKIDELRKAQAELAAALSAQSYKVAPAGYVSAGDVVGTVGNSGLSTGAHLHLEMRINGSVTNPAPYIRQQPVLPTIVNQAYGRWDPIYISGRHPGIDYAPGNGAIRAIDGGMLYRGCSNALLGTSTNPYGYVAIVDHGGGKTSVYAHMAGGPSSCSYNTYY